MGSSILSVQPQAASWQTSISTFGLVFWLYLVLHTQHFCQHPSLGSQALVTSLSRRGLRQTLSRTLSDLWQESLRQHQSLRKFLLERMTASRIWIKPLRPSKEAPR